MEDRLKDNSKKTHDDQHLDWWKRHMAATTDVVAYKIARARQQLKECVDERAGIHSPKDGYVVLDRIPSDMSHLGTLAAARKEVVGKLGAAVVAMLYAALVAIDIVRHGLLPVPEPLAILFYLFLLHL